MHYIVLIVKCPVFIRIRIKSLLGEYQAQADVADQLAADIQKKLNG